MNKYQYQITAAHDTFEMLQSKQYMATVLAAAPGAGKTTIVVEIINKILAHYPHYKIVLLTHNQNNLVDQTITSFNQGFIQPKFAFGDFNQSYQVSIGIPASIGKITECDVLIVDEAHQYYQANMVQNFINKFQPKMQLLMTGSPSCFNEINNNSLYPVYGMYFIAGDELAEKDVYSKVIIDVAVKGSDIVETFINAWDKAKADDRFDDSKLMIACKSIEEARILGNHLKQTGRLVAISTSADDSDNADMFDFKSGKLDTLIVVNRGILGFSDEYITALFDFKCSKSIDNRYQLLARVFRKHPKNIEKFYISASSIKNMDKELQVIYNTVELMSIENFTK